MLTATQRRHCVELAQALDRGDYATYRRAEPTLTPAEKAMIWNERAHVKAQAERKGQQGGKAVVQVPPPDRAAIDLDFWSDDIAPAEPDDDDLPDSDKEQTTKICPTCQGKGRDHSGDTCETCGGSGRIPLDDFDDGGDDDREDDDGEDED